MQQKMQTEMIVTQRRRWLPSQLSRVVDDKFNRRCRGTDEEAKCIDGKGNGEEWHFGRPSVRRAGLAF
ncbi:hypothetical protein ACLOJK_028205 [Asimina triloba]